MDGKVVEEHNNIAIEAFGVGRGVVHMETSIIDQDGGVGRGQLAKVVVKVVYSEGDRSRQKRDGPIPGKGFAVDADDSLKFHPL